MHTWRKIARGKALVHAGDSFHALYAIRSGSFKTVVSHPNGASHVTGFQLAGEMRGRGQLTLHARFLLVEQASVQTMMGTGLQIGGIWQRPFPLTSPLYVQFGLGIAIVERQPSVECMVDRVADVARQMETRC